MTLLVLAAAPSIAREDGGLNPPATPIICHGKPAAARPAKPTCRRPTAGSDVLEPSQLFSRRGKLDLELDYVSSIDEAGRKLFCFVTPDGLESPTLHVRPGDTLNIRLTNLVSQSPTDAATAMSMSMSQAPCGAARMNATSVNMHFHGTNTPIACHADEVMHTFVNSGETFDYHVRFPASQPPGLYWYHPHVHGQAEAAVKGGASGAIVVDGIESLQTAVAGLPERTLIIRDQTVAGEPPPGGPVPTSDVSLNYVPISYPVQVPAIIRTERGRREFWRVLNATAETVVDLRLTYDGIDQPLAIVGLDGVPTGSDDGNTTGKVLTVSHILIPAAGRAEFIINSPSERVKRAVLATQAIAMGPDGDIDPARTLAVLEPGGEARAAALSVMPHGVTTARQRSPAGIDRAAVTSRRKIYFSETLADPYDPGSQPKYFITLEGATPRIFDPAAPPAIITRQDAVEEWTIENRSHEMHEFHIHQVHFKLLQRNGAELPAEEQQYLDTVQVPFWTGKGPYPSVTLLLDFRGTGPGDLLYHCHMLDHEDGGMMAIVRVLPRAQRQKR